jgi:hypothetical protein
MAVVAAAVTLPDSSATAQAKGKPACDQLRRNATSSRSASVWAAMTGTDAAARQLRIQKSELYRTLSALRAIGKAGTCAAISEKASELAAPVRKYNTDRALKAVPEFAERVKRSEHLLSYKLTGRDEALLELLDKVGHLTNA